MKKTNDVGGTTGGLPRTGIFASIIVVLIFIAGQALAGVTGKVSGVVVNTESGDPVVGASVRVTGTSLTTTTDEDGEYFIINVPVGEYDLNVTHVGFEGVVKEGVRILVDLTTPVDFEMREVAVQLGQEVIVRATKPLVQRDLTASRIIFTSDRLRSLPNTISVQSILTNYPGVVIDRDQELHVRGGRSGQVSYFYDGFSVQDPFYATAGIRIMPGALEELSLTSGGFAPEYGEALSGVVSAVTREGAASYHGGVRMWEGATKPYDVNTGTWGNMKLTDDRSLAANLSGPIPGLDPQRYTFFSAGEYLRTIGSLPHDWEVAYTGSAKLSMQPIPTMRIRSNVTYHTADGAVYTHRDVNGRSYDFNLDGLPEFNREAYLAGLSANYSFNMSSILSLALNRFSTETKRAPHDLFDLHWTDWPGYSENGEGVYDGDIHEANYGNDPDYSDEQELVGFTTGDDYNPTYAWRQSQYNSLRLSLVNQINKIHQIKTGIEYRHFNIEWDFKQFYNSQPYGEQYSSKPTYASFFIQDKMELREFVVNFGIRYDYRDADITYNAAPGEETPAYREAEANSRWSPRLGISFPISERSKMHFNYGVYYQAPRFTYLYTNLQGDISSGFPLLGNPDLEPEQTTSYELGLDHLLADDIRLDVTAYYKDISDLVTTRTSFKVAGKSVTKFFSDDYGSVKGFDLSLEKLARSGFLSGSISYSYMIANGNGSTALEPYYTFLTSTIDTLAPVTEYPLDFDQRHTLTAVVDYRVPLDWHGNLFGLPVPGGWGMNVVGYYGSGLPYTTTDNQGNRLGERNDSRLPPSYTVDMRLNKDFGMAGGGALFTVFVEVDNLFDRRNVIDVYSQTGSPDDDNFRTLGGLSLNQQELDRLDHLYDHDPQNYSPPRTIRTGIEYRF